MVLGAACQGDNLQRPPLIPDNELFWDLALSHHAVTLSTAPGYDTLTVVATPRNVQGEPLAGLPAPQYISTDQEYVTVTPEGRVVAVKPTPAPSPSFLPVRVVATLIYDNLKHADTLFVQVVDEPDPAAHVLAMLSIHPVPPDSAKRAAYSGIKLPGSVSTPSDDDLLADSLRLRATAVDNAALPTPLFVYYRSADTTILTVGVNKSSVSPGGWDHTSARLFPKRPGTTTIYATATVFGVTKADTLLFRVGAPILGHVSIERGTSPGTLVSFTGNGPSSDVTVGTGGLIQFQNSTSAPGQALVPVDFVFDDAQLSSVISVNDSPFWQTAQVVFGFTYPVVCGFVSFDCGAGNISPIDESVFNGVALRVFSEPGTYNFHSPLTGLNGRIIVVDER